MAERRILIVSGTNRPGANALRVAKLVESHYRAIGVEPNLLSLNELPREIFDGAAYATKPPGMLEIQQRILDALGLHIITPEYNGSFPGVLKYFIDMLKFPESFDAKPVAFVGEAAGLWGGLRAVEQLQMIFGYRNAHIFPDRVFIPGIVQKFDAAGNFGDVAVNERLAKQAAGFARYAAHVQTAH
jgi:chromate reductase, NAD(P)H dehydrogenase (quinone)